jgi:uncharacterized protein (TIGR02598 family)
MTHATHSPAAFTLVEVTLALASAVIALVALLGLLVAGHDAGRHAADTVITASLAQDLFQDIRSQPYTNVNVTGTARDLRTFAGHDGTLHYDGAGFDTLPATARFRCQLDFQPAAGNPALTQARVTIVWPALVAYPPHTNVFFTSIAQLD